MKFFVAFVILFQVALGKHLPTYLKTLTCARNDPKYTECLIENLEKARPSFIKGIPELNVPPLDPFELPIVSVNRTLNDLVSIYSVLRNVRVEGLGNAVAEYIKADPISMTAELRYSVPWTSLEMEYDVAGQLLVVPLQSKGFFKGNFTDFKAYVKGSLKTYEKQGKTYAKVDKLFFKGVVGNGWVKMTSKNPDLQFGADLISSFYNANPRAVMDAVNPIFNEFTTDLFRAVANQILATIPISEFVSEE